MLLKWFVFYGIENIVGKEENAGNHHVLPFPMIFAKPHILISGVSL